MIQNPIIHKHGETIEPLYGKLTLRADSETIEIPVSRLCSKCVIFPMSINRTTDELDTNYSGGTDLQVGASNLPVIYSSNQIFDGLLLRKSSTKVFISALAGSNVMEETLFNFASDKITINMKSSANVISFSKGTYIYVAW